jgi:hypothetical protein
LTKAAFSGMTNCLGKGYNLNKTRLSLRNSAKGISIASSAVVAQIIDFSAVSFMASDQVLMPTMGMPAFRASAISDSLPSPL